MRKAEQLNLRASYYDGEKDAEAVLSSHFKVSSVWHYARDSSVPEIFEWVDHPSFVGVKLHPELKSDPFDPHPQSKDFIRATKSDERLA